MDPIFLQLIKSVINPCLCPSGQNCGSGIAGEIVRILSGSSKIRVGNNQTDNQIAYSTNKVQEYICRNATIPLSIMWGGSKGYGLFDHYLRPDLCEVMAVSRFEGMAKAVEQIYPPGILFRIILEDVSERLTTPVSAECPRNMQLYRQTFQQYIDAFGVTHVILDRESNLMIAKGFSVDERIDRGRFVGTVFKKFWLASEKVADERTACRSS